MTPWRTALCTLLAVTCSAICQPAEAGWQGTFQATCFRKWCRSCETPVVANYAPSCSSCAPQVSCCAPAPTCCETRYVQRSFYQPVTTMQCRSFYEPVTTMRTSYSWEPQTSCRTSCYWDPCTCSYRTVSTPVTTYSLKQNCCPVTSFVQRTMMVPVTSYRIASYWEPQTCCNSSPCATGGCSSCATGGCSSCGTGGGVVASAAPGSPGCCGGSAPAGTAPAVSADTANPPAAVQESRQPAPGGTSPLYDQKNSSPLPNNTGVSDKQTGFRPMVPQMRAPVTPTYTPRQPAVQPRLDKIAQAETNGPKARLARRITVVDEN